MPPTLFCLFSRVHIAKRCKSQIKCYKCSGRHHLAVCYHNGGDPPNNKETSCQHVGSTSSNYSVLLQTAHVNIRNRNITSFARILFDNGSQLSYITPELRNRLQLETIDTREICIKTFGSVTTKETLDRVNVKLTSIKGKDIYVRCYVKEICQPLTAQNTKFAIEHYQHLRKLKLAVLLQTARVNIRVKTYLIRSDFFLIGSQLSDITPELRNRLQLETIDTREICIETFGSVTTKETLDRANVKLTSIKGKDIYVRCYVKEICQPLTAQNTKFAI